MASTLQSSMWQDLREDANNTQRQFLTILDRVPDTGTKATQAADFLGARLKHLCLLQEVVAKRATVLPSDGKETVVVKVEDDQKCGFRAELTDTVEEAGEPSKGSNKGIQVSDSAASVN